VTFFWRPGGSTDSWPPESLRGAGRWDAVKAFISDVLVIRSSSDDILHMIKNAAAVITEEPPKNQGGNRGRRLDIPVLAGAVDATKILKSGTVVTVDAGKGLVTAASVRYETSEKEFPH
jgi:phosphohistidine swiveling domain-containing protein